MRTVRALLVAALLAYGLSACSGDDTRTLTVHAAASLSSTFTELGEQFATERAADGERVEVDFNFAGSSDLVAQVDQGAPADVLATADEATMARVDADQLAGEPQVFAANTLTLVVPPDNPADVTGLSDLARDDLSLVVCAPEVPCGAAAVRVTEGAGIELAPVSEEHNVTDVLGKVRSGEADAGLVYVTDAVAAGDAVRTIDVPEAADVVNLYPIAPLAHGDDEQRTLAADFVAFVLGEAGQRVLVEAGFARP